jgi:acetyl esterase/lipase
MEVIPMPSIQAKTINFVFRCMSRNKNGTTPDYEAERKRNDRKPPKTPKGLSVSKIKLNDLPGEMIIKEGNKKGYIFYIHGGGFTTGSAQERRGICQYIVNKYGYNCVSINYRLAPENLWPAQLDDCFTAYKNFLESGVSPENIIFMGESAGGTLVLSLALLLKERNLPQPKAIVSFSPCVTHSDIMPSHTYNIKTDYMLRDAVRNGEIKVVFGDNNDVETLRNPTISPLYGDYSNLPPIFLSASDSEVLLDDSKILHDKLRALGHKTEIDIQQGVCHAFQVFTSLPEARHTLSKVFLFINDLD